MKLERPISSHDPGGLVRPLSTARHGYDAAAWREVFEPPLALPARSHMLRECPTAAYGMAVISSAPWSGAAISPTLPCASNNHARVAQGWWQPPCASVSERHAGTAAHWHTELVDVGLQ